MRKMLSENIEQLNFADEPDQCSKHINEFFKKTTKNHIENVLDSGVITPETQFIITSAAYFRGKWV